MAIVIDTSIKVSTDTDLMITVLLMETHAM